MLIILGFALSFRKDIVSSFIKDYISALKEFAEKVLVQLSISQTFVNGLFPNMTSEGAYVKILVSKNEM